MSHSGEYGLRGVGGFCTLSMYREGTEVIRDAAFPWNYLVFSSAVREFSENADASIDHCGAKTLGMPKNVQMLEVFSFRLRLGLNY